MEEDLQLLKRVVGDVLGRPDIDLSPEERTVSIPGWDSVAMVQILLLLESETGKVFDTMDVANIKTVGDLLSILEKSD